MTTNLSRSRAPAFLALVLTAALWGSNTVVSRALLDTIPPVTMAALRWGVVLMTLLPAMWPERRAVAQSLKTHWKVLLALAFLGGAPQSMVIFAGLERSTAIHLGLLNSTIPVLIILISWAWRGRRPRALESAGLTVSLAGVLLILAHGEWGALLALAFNPGDLLMLCGMITWSLYTLRLKDRPQSLSLFALLFVIAVLGEAMVLPLAAAEWAIAGRIDIGARQLVGLLYIGVFTTLVSNVAYSYGVERVGAVQAGIFIHVMPVFASVFAALFIGERLYPYHAAGFLLVAGGAIVSCLKRDPVLSSSPSART